MATTAITDLLQKLITITSEREPLTLELMLLKTISDFTSQDSTVLYTLTDKKLEIFSALSSNGKNLTIKLPDAFKAELIKSFKSSKPIILDVPITPCRALLYPLKNNKNVITSTIAVSLNHADPNTEVIIKSLLKIYQNYIGLINENERDTLTGLLNRKTFDTKINKVFAALISQHARKDDKLEHKSFLAIFDIDHFKRVNDDFGHLIGDEVLLLFSQLMTQTFREQDLLFRFGGEEFVGIFDCPSLEDVSRVINRFREKVSAFNFPQIGLVTVSVGYTQLSSDDNASLLIDRADAALYYAKNHGRNCAHSYEQLVANGHLQEIKKDSDIELF